MEDHDKTGPVRLEDSATGETQIDELETRLAELEKTVRLLENNGPKSSEGPVSAEGEAERESQRTSGAPIPFPRPKTRHGRTPGIQSPEGEPRSRNWRLNRDDSFEADLVATTREMHGELLERLGALTRDNERLRGQLRNVRISDNALTARSVELTALSEMAPFGIVLLDDQAQFEFVNSAFVSMFGYEPNEINEPDQMAHLPPFDKLANDRIFSSWLVAAKDAAQCDPDTLSYAVTCKDGVKKGIRFRCVRLSTGGFLMTCEEEAMTPARRDASDPAVTVLRSTLDAIPEGVLAVDSEGQILANNPQFAEMWKIPERVMESQSTEDVDSAIRKQLKIPRKIFSDHKVASMAEGESAAQIIELTDGRTFELKSEARWIEPVGPIRLWRVAEMKAPARGEEGHLSDENQLRNFLKRFPLAFVSCDSRGKLLDTNPQLLRLFGCPGPKEARILNLLETPFLVESGFSGHVRRCFDTKEPATVDFAATTAWGKKVHCKAHLTPVQGAQGGVEQVRAIVEDITDRKRAEGLVLRYQGLKALGEMAGGVTHSLSNFLQIVIGNTNMALTNLELDEFEEMRTNLEQILDSTRAASEAVRRFQQFGRRRPHGEAPKKIFDINEAVTIGVEICKLWSKGMLERKRIEISHVLELGPNCHILGRQDQIVEVVVNLLRNAVEAMPKGGTVAITTFKDERHVCMRVQDDGIGISKENIERVVEPFWSSKESHGGVGLSVSAGIVRQHGGSLGVKRLKPRGTSFVVKLPPAVHVALPAPRPEPPKREESRTFRLLLIDDDRPVVTILGKGLGKRGSKVYVACSGAEGVSLLERNEVDAVICDLGMEGMNGWDVSVKVREVSVTKGIPKPPFILLTGWAGQLAEDEILKHPDVDRIIEKPVTIPKLLDILGQEIRRAKARP